MEEQALSESVPLRSAACTGLRAHCFLDLFPHQNIWKTEKQSLDCAFGGGSRQVCAISVLHIYFPVKKQGFCGFPCLAVSAAVFGCWNVCRKTKDLLRRTNHSKLAYKKKRRNSVCSHAVMRSWFSILFPLLVF